MIQVIDEKAVKRNKIESELAMKQNDNKVKEDIKSLMIFAVGVGVIVAVIASVMAS